MAKGMCGYSRKTIERKAAKRGMSAFEYALYLTSRRNNGIPRYDMVRRFFNVD